MFCLYHDGMVAPVGGGQRGVRKWVSLGSVLCFYIGGWWSPKGLHGHSKGLDSLSKSKIPIEHSLTTKFSLLINYTNNMLCIYTWTKKKKKCLHK